MRPVAPAIAGSSGVGSPCSPAPETRKTESEIPIAAASAAGSVGET